MSRTHKDKPSAVQLHHGVWKRPDALFYVEHVCADRSHDVNNRYLTRMVLESLDADQLRACDMQDFRYYPSYSDADRDGRMTCRVEVCWRQGDKPSKKDVSLTKQKPYRRRVRKELSMMTREFNTGFDDVGEDDSRLPVTWRGPKVMGGGYWD